MQLLLKKTSVLSGSTMVHPHKGGTSYSYVIVPNISSTEMANYKINVARIIANTTNVQAVRDSEIDRRICVYYDWRIKKDERLRTSFYNHSLI